MKHGMVTLRVHEAKRLIAKGVAALPQVKQALKNHTIIIAGGTTNGYVAEELSGKSLAKEQYSAGIICGGRCCVTPGDTRIEPLVIEKGQVVETQWQKALETFKPGDIFIKGANAFDLQGNIGILLASPVGGTIGTAIGTLAARGIELICPVGLEKLVPSVLPGASLLGVGKLDYSRGLASGMMVIPNATIHGEDKALAHLTGCNVAPAAMGGIGDSNGATTLAFAGDEDQFTQAMAILESIRGGKPLPSNSRKCPCGNPCDYGRPQSSR